MYLQKHRLGLSLAGHAGLKPQVPSVPASLLAPLTVRAPCARRPWPMGRVTRGLLQGPLLLLLLLLLLLG